MNRLAGIITTIQVDAQLSLIQVKVHDVLFSAIVIDTPATCSYLKVGHRVSVIFKETEVIIATGTDHALSLQNRLPGSILTLDIGTLLSKITIETQVGPIASIITTRAVQQLQLGVGVAVTAMIKTNEVMLSP